MIGMIEWIVSSSVLVAVVILLRALLKGKISLRLQYALWGLVLLRLLAPVSFGSASFSVQNALPKEAKSIPQSVMIRGEAQIRTEQETYSYALPAQREQYEAKRQELKRAGEQAHVAGCSELIDGLSRILTGIWIAGMSAVALCLLVSNLRFALRLRKTRKLLREETLPVYLTAETDTPCLFGLFRPAVYVTPEAAEEEGRLRHVIEHELTHYRHADHLWSLLRGLCLILHWYNPLVWWGAILSRRDCELACDEATIRRLGEGERASYGRTLIYMTCLKRPAILVTATTMTGSKGSIKERIALIVKKPRTAVITLIMVILAAAVAVGCTFTGGKEPGTEPTAAPTPAPSVKATPELTAQPTEAADEVFLEMAWPLVEDYCRKTGRLCKEEGEVVRHADGAGVEVIYPTLGKRYRVIVLFAKGEDGSWALAEPVSFSVIVDGERERARLEADLGDQNLPEPVLLAALRLAQEELDFYEDSCGYVFDEARLTGVTQINTGTAGLTEAINLYLVEYRFLPAPDQEILLSGGMTMEDGWLTEWGSTGQPYLLMLAEDKEDGQHWMKLGRTNTDTITQEYGTPEMLEKYGNPYTAAAMELGKRFRNQAEAPMPIYFTVYSPSSAPEGIGLDWAETLANTLTSAPEGDPCRCEAFELRSSEYIAESLLSGPKSFVYTMEFACDPADEEAFRRYLGAGFGTDTEHPDWLCFRWFVELACMEDGGWQCVRAGADGYGSWGYLNYDWDVTELLDRIVTEQVGGEDALMLLPLIDWAEFDKKFGSETWNTLERKCEEACINEGQSIYGRSFHLTDDQMIRDLYVILGFLHADGAYAEGLAYMMEKQYDYDPMSFEQCLTQCLHLTEEQERSIRLSVGNEGQGEALYDAQLRFYDASGNPVSDVGGWYELSRVDSIGVAWSGEAPLGVRLLTTPTGTGTYDQTQILAQRSLTQEETEGKEIRFLLSDLINSAGMGHLWAELDYGTELRATAVYPIYREAESVSLSRQDITLMRIGESYTLLATVTPAGSGAAVRWFSQDTEVATVDENGTVTAVGPGTTKIIADVGGIGATCIIRVPDTAAGQNEQEGPGTDTSRQSGAEKKIWTLILPVEIILTGRGGTYSIQPSITPRDSGEKIRWTSGDPAVATVDENGRVTAVSDGKTVIRAEAENVYAECTVRVEQLASEDGESVAAALHIYDGPTREKREPKGQSRVILDGGVPEEAEAINEIKSIIDGIRFWTNDEMVDRTAFYFDGDIVFSDREFVYYFSFDKRTIFYDRYFAAISQKDMEYIQSIAGG